MTTGNLFLLAPWHHSPDKLRMLGAPEPVALQRIEVEGKNEEPAAVARTRAYAARMVEHMKLDDDVPIGRLEKNP